MYIYISTPPSNYHVNLGPSTLDSNLHAWGFHQGVTTVTEKTSQGYEAAKEGPSLTRFVGQGHGYNIYFMGKIYGDINS